MSEGKAEPQIAKDARVCDRDGCGNWFVPAGGKGSGKGSAGGKPQRYCSPACGTRARRKAQQIPPQPMECPGCGVTFTPRRGPGRRTGKAPGKPQIYCTQKCGNRAREAVRLAAARSQREIEPVECRGCGERFVPRVKRQKHHGLACLYAARAGRRIDPPTDYDPIRGRVDGHRRVALAVRQCFWCGDPFTGKGRAVCPKLECGIVRRSLVGVTHRHHISRDQYMALWREQDGKCAICGSPPSNGARLLHVDHDHACCPTAESCGQCVRGLLCFPCNAGIGQLGDDTKMLQRAIDYVTRTRQGRLVLVAS